MQNELVAVRDRNGVPLRLFGSRPPHQHQSREGLRMSGPQESRRLEIVRNHGESPVSARNRNTSGDLSDCENSTWW